MAELGFFEGPDGSRGVRREALSDADKRARALLDSFAADLGLDRVIDEVGNTFYRRKGSGGTGAAIAFGSHLDSQPAGGRFDGSFGVLAGLEVLRTLQDAGQQTSLDLELVNWSNEEGSRFAPAIMGSGVATGEVPLQVALAATARGEPNVTFGAELLRQGLAGDVRADVSARSWLGYFEAHIEQGPMLEAAGAQVGVVTGGQGQYTFSVHVSGFEGHSGTVPMSLRQDAVVCASSMILSARGIGLARAVLMTVGSLAVSPNSFNTIAGGVTFSVDIRSPDEEALHAAEADMRSSFATIVRQENCTGLDIQRLKARAPVLFDEVMVGHVRSSAIALDRKWLELWSGAGHDACYTATQLPSTMIFVPCARGISHNPRESATEEDVALGASVLLGAVLRADVALAAPRG